MLPMKNQEDHYGVITLFFHWLIAILMIGMVILGLYMVELPVSLNKLKWYTWHKQIGITILGLAALRLIWRFTSRIPALPQKMPKWQQLMAHATHWALYLLMFALPISGWVLISAAGVPLSYFGLFIIPNLVTHSRELMHTVITIHHWLGYALIILIGVHSGAALMHHFVDKDNVLRRMLPW